MSCICSYFTSTSGTDVFLLILYIFCLPKKNINSNTANLGGGLFFHFLKINGDIFLRNQHVLLFPYSVFLVNVGCWLCPRFLDQFLIICFHSFGRSNDLLFLAMCNEMGRMISCVFLNGLYTYLYI